MKDSTKNWFVLAEKELKLAEFAYKASEPIGIIYHLHACIEKVLKGIYDEMKGSPPRIHSLKKLAIESCNLPLEERKRNLFDLLDKAFIDSRYPEDVVSFEKKYNLENCVKLIKEVKEIVIWLKSLMKES